MSTAASTANSAATSSVAFSPQDYSRFLIREFLKKNGFNQTYEMFMTEDTRPKVTMTKNQLTALLGIETLMKKNHKSKSFTTMLDIICHHLVESKEDADSPPPVVEKKARPQRPDDAQIKHKPAKASGGWGEEPVPSSNS